MKSKAYDSQDIREIVQKLGIDQLMDDAIEVLADGCREFDKRSTLIPIRDGFEYSEPEVGLIEWMPAMRAGADVVLKMVGYHPTNPSIRGLPTILSTVLTFDTHTGQLLDIMDGTFLTALRTGAISAVVSRILAHPESSTLGLIGAGAQSITQLHALSRVFPLRDVLVYDIDPACAHNFADRAAQLGTTGINFSITALEDLVSRADIICTATSVEIGEGPVFADMGLQPHTHINAVGADFSGKFEIPHSVLQRALVCPDFIDQALKEGECQQLRRDQIGPDIIELSKNAESYHDQRAKITVFDSTGWALEDYIVSRMLAGHGERLGCGREIEFTNLSANPKNPYEFLNLAPDCASENTRQVPDALSIIKS